MTSATPPLVMTEEMRSAWDRLGQDNVFITGKAGTGKSTMLQAFCSTTRQVVKVAPTGVAALNIGGSTIHSFFRFKPGIQPYEAALAKPQKEEVYRSIGTLIFDEMSMIRADLLDCVDAFLRKYGPYPGDPFGGVRVACFGDPYQLPPVVPTHEKVLLRDYRSRHFFAAKSYSNIPTVELTQPFRQTDQEFLHALDGIRDGSATDGDLEIFHSRVEPDVTLEQIRDSGATLLMAYKSDVHKFNSAVLDSLPGQVQVFNAKVSGYFPEGIDPTDRILNLKVGAKVMLLINNPPLWVNGTVGTVTRIIPGYGGGIVVELPSGADEFVESCTWTHHRYVTVKGRIEQVPAGEFTQLPVKLAWASTIHKAQGLTLDRVIVDERRGMFDAGQLYVALSRVRTLGGLTLTPRPVRKGDIIIDPHIRQFMASAIGDQ